MGPLFVRASELEKMSIRAGFVGGQTPFLQSGASL